MRKSGILMHITSLPSPYGIGSMGKCAYDFVDFLKAAGQSYWQILPISPTGYGDSPYQALSAFAGNHYLIDLDTLVEEGLLKREEVEDIHWGSDPERVDFGSLYNHRTKVLRRAYERFLPESDYRVFVEENADWLPDYALFMALKESFSGKPWQNWSVTVMLRLPALMETYRQSLKEDIRFHCFLQYQFFRQWKALRTYANDSGIQIIGDVPIYVPLDSADVWANPQMFHLDGSCRPVKVAGCPPDSFNADGQLWGNPIYNWQQMAVNGYDWWIRRLKAAQKLYDIVRLDHFRGFESYWAVPYGDKTAAGGTWEKGPGMDFIRAVRQALPDMGIIAEDLGFLTPQVRQLQEDSGYPGMKVIQFAFDSREAGNYLPYTYPEHSVCYTGTHDNLTLKQWFQEADPVDIKAARAYLGLNEEEGLIKGMIRGCMSAASRLCVVQIQDYLELDGHARMNFPGTLSGNNWTWRALPGFMTEELCRRILEITRRYGRD